LREGKKELESGSTSPRLNDDVDVDVVVADIRAAGAEVVADPPTSSRASASCRLPTPTAA
jgi:hypothetical protein